jgi:hypothetical protein
MQKVQHMGFCGDTLGQRHFHGYQHRLFLVMQNQRKDVDHLSVTTRLAQHMVLQLLEGRGKFREGRTVPERTRFRLRIPG